MLSAQINYFLGCRSRKTYIFFRTPMYNNYIPRWYVWFLFLLCLWAKTTQKISPAGRLTLKFSTLRCFQCLVERREATLKILWILLEIFLQYTYNQHYTSLLVLFLLLTSRHRAHHDRKNSYSYTWYTYQYSIIGGTLIVLHTYCSGITNKVLHADA